MIPVLLVAFFLLDFCPGTLSRLPNVACNETDWVDCLENHGKDIQVDDGVNLPVGEALNIFHRYGFLSFSIHVAPIQMNDSRLFRENTFAVLQRKLFQLDVQRYSRSERHMQLHLCESVDGLISSFLQKFTIEGLQKPWRAFTASWRRQLLPRMFGVPAVYLNDDFRFLLVRIEKRSVIGSIGGQAVLDESLLQRISDLNEGNLRQAIDFFLDYGTHIINGYISGDALYQVLVYSPQAFQQLRLRFQDFDINNATRASLTNLFTHYPSHVGKLQLASGNRTFVQWLESRLAVSSLPKTLPSSVRLMAAPILLNHFYRHLQEKAVLGLDLVSITRAVPDLPKRHWLEDVLNNLLRIWEYNM